MIAGMLLEFKMTPGECERILHPIEHHEREKTPTLHVHSLLCSQTEWSCLKANRQTKANDHSDLWRLAIALNYADVIACDAARRANPRVRLSEPAPILTLRLSALTLTMSGIRIVMSENMSVGEQFKM